MAPLLYCFISEGNGKPHGVSPGSQPVLLYRFTGKSIYDLRPDKLERILFNLLSNAFKFTSGNGSVSVEVSAAKNAGDVLLAITVKDTGIGIPPDRQQKIFETFFQNDIPSSLINQGSGIGLATSREFVHLFNGTIRWRLKKIKAPVLPYSFR